MEYPTPPTPNDDRIYIGPTAYPAFGVCNDIMVDLETMGTASTAPVIAIGAVAFKYENGVLTIGGEFYRTIDLRSEQNAGAVIEAGTVMWWMQQSDAARRKLTSGEVSAHEALQEFALWLVATTNEPRIWGNGASFDNVILVSAYKRHGIALPWNYYNDRCYRTLKNLAPHIHLVRTGTHHNALDDARVQTNHLGDICRELKLTELA